MKCAFNEKYLMNIDRIDKEILRIIQLDASLTTAEIAEQVGLTTTPKCFIQESKNNLCEYLQI